MFCHVLVEVVNVVKLMGSLYDSFSQNKIHFLKTKSTTSRHFH